MRSPIAVAAGSAVFSTIPGVAKLFRTDFRRRPFDVDWVQVSHEDEKAGMSNSTAKLARAGSLWSVRSAADKQRFHRAMLVAGQHLFIASASDALLVHDTGTGRLLSEMKLPRTAWDGLASFPHGLLYVSTAEGKVLCLGETGDTSTH